MLSKIEYAQKESDSFIHIESKLAKNNKLSEFLVPKNPIEILNQVKIEEESQYQKAQQKSDVDLSSMMNMNQSLLRLQVLDDQHMDSDAPKLELQDLDFFINFRLLPTMNDVNEECLSIMNDEKRGSKKRKDLFYKLHNIMILLEKDVKNLSDCFDQYQESHHSGYKNKILSLSEKMAIQRALINIEIE